MPGGCEAIVFCDKIAGVLPSYDWEGVPVRRCWSTGPLYIWQVLNAIRKEKVDVVHIQHEVFLYGRTLSAALFPLLPLLLRLSRKPVVVTLHNGILPRSNLSKEFLRENGIEGNPTIMRSGLSALMKLIVLVSNKVIVHEQAIKDVLTNDYDLPPERIEVVHHGIEGRKEPLPMADAKRALGLEGRKVVLFLGYIAGYKNLDLLIDSARYLKGDDWVILIGGGEHPRLKNDPHYLDYIAHLKEKAREISPDKIRFIGFVREMEIPLYVSASDLMVFPYRAFVSASGPLTIALTYGRPILVSSAFRSFVNDDDETFGNDPRDLATKIERMLASGPPSKEREQLHRQLFAERQWSVASTKTCEVYNEVRPK